MSARRVLAALLALWPAAAAAQLDADRLLLPQRQVDRPLVQVPGRSGKADRSYFRDGIAETVRYAGADRAEIRIEVSGPRTGTGPTLSMTKPSQAGITAELAREFPGETMIVVRTPLQNAYGPVGMAAGERCLYAWQWIDSVSRPDDAAGRLFAASGARPASLRVRLCRRPGESIADLGRAVQRLRIADPLGQPVATPTSAPARAVARRPKQERAAAAEQAPAPPIAAPPSAAPSPAAPPPRSAPASGYAAVPLPSAAQPVGQRPFVTTIDRGTAPATPPAPVPAAPLPAAPRPVQAAPAVPVPLPAPAAGGETRRYITDQQTGEAGQPATIVPRPARGGMAETGEPFTGSLPAEAYRGPGR